MATDLENVDPTEVLLNLLRAFRDKKQGDALNCLDVLWGWVFADRSLPDVPRVLFKLQKEPIPGWAHYVQLGRAEMADETVQELSAVIVCGVKDSLNRGVEYYNDKGKRLITVREVLMTMADECPACKGKKNAEEDIFPG